MQSYSLLKLKGIDYFTFEDCLKRLLFTKLIVLPIFHHELSGVQCSVHFSLYSLMESETCPLVPMHACATLLVVELNYSKSFQAPFLQYP